MTINLFWKFYKLGCVESLVGFIGANFFAHGSKPFKILAWFYCKFFDQLFRQRITNQSKQVALTQSNNDWENPKVVGRKRRKMHHKSRSFFSREKALNYWRTKLSTSKPPVDALFPVDKSENILLLTGESGSPDLSNLWRFKLVSDPESCPQDWEKRTFVGDNDWSDVALPNHWQLQGFDIPMYSNTAYAFRFNPPYVRRDGEWKNTDTDVGIGGTKDGEGQVNPKELGYNPTGLYRKHFQVPERWLEEENDNIFLVFEGVDSCFYAYIDGECVGYSQDSCLSAEFDVTSYFRGKKAREASHLIAVKVLKYCDGSYLEDQDKWTLSGIYREVYFIRKPKTFVSDLEFSSTIDFAHNQAKVEVDVLVENAREGQIVRAELFEYPALSDRDAVPVVSLTAMLHAGEKFSRRIAADHILDCDAAEVDCSHTKNAFTAALSAVIDRPKLWSAETPHLYLLVVTVHPSREDSDTVLHCESQRVGIRSVTIGGFHNQLLVNNRPVVIAGVNRLEFDAKTGRAMSKKSMREDAIFLKKNNFNAVRSAHYPQHDYWISLCDEFGLYYIDEANLETHGFQIVGGPVGYLFQRKDWQAAIGSRVSRMYERDKNHACIIIWSLGNECGYHPFTHDLLYRWLHARDPSRPVQYEAGGSCTNATDIICPMYQRPDWCLEQAHNDAKQRPVILCEYAHAMGNSGGCLEHYWRLFYDDREPRMQGGFIWDFIDQGIAVSVQKSDANGNSVEVIGYNYGGDFKDFPNTNHFCCNGLLAPDRTPFPDFYAAKYLQCPVKATLLHDGENFFLELCNKRSHTDLADIRVDFAVHVHYEVGKDQFVGPEQSLFPGDVAPGQKRLLLITADLLRAAHEFESVQGDKSMLEVWLAVRIVKVKGSANFNEDADVELSSVSLQDKSLTQAVIRAISSVQKVFESPFDVSIEMMNTRVKVTDGWTITFENNGQLSQMTDKYGNELLAKPLEVCLYRAPTPNDNGLDFVSYATKWKIAGYDRLTQGKCNLKIDYAQKAVIASGVLENEGTGLRLPCEWRYQFSRAGEVTVTLNVTPAKFLPPLARVGFRFALQEVFAGDACKVRWFGRGPCEAYEDRKANTTLSVFTATVDDLHTRYTYPQENGRRADPRWIEFYSNSAKLTLIPGQRPGEATGYGFNASRFSLEQLETARHDYELKSEGIVHVHLDSRTMGVAGYDSWSPNVPLHYQILPTGEPISTVCVFRYSN